MSPRVTFLALWGAVLVAFILLVGAFNLVMDPYRYFGVQLKGLNERKPRPNVDLTTIKRAAATHVDASAVILGNSRADIGFDPEHPLWAARSLSAFNLAVPGSGIDGALRNLEWLSTHRKLRLALVGLDFIDFMNEPDWVDDQHGVGAAAVLLSEKARALFSVAALRDSARTIGVQTDPYAATLTRRGFNPLLDYVPIVQREGYNALFRQRADDNARRYLTLVPRARDFERPRSRAIVALERMITLCRQRNIDLVLVIYPYHAQMLVMFDSARLWDAFLDWKRTMVRLTAAGSGAAEPKVVLWDFSGFNAYSIEHVPPPNDHRTELAYYWEAGHFKKALGDRVLERVLGGAPDIDSFGVLLTRKSVEPSLEQQTTALARYKMENADAVQEIESIVAAQCRILARRAPAAACRDARPSSLPAPDARSLQPASDPGGAAHSAMRAPQ